MKANAKHVVTLAFAPLLAAVGCSNGASAQTQQLMPSTMPRIEMVDERYQSYNVEMLEVNGGRFWRPYNSELADALRQPAPSIVLAGDTPSGTNPALYEYRPPIDLTNARLRKLAAARTT